MATTAKKRTGIMKRGDKWVVRIRIHGRDVWESYSSKETAMTRRAQLELDADREKAHLPKRSLSTFEEYAPKYLAWFKLHNKSWKRHELSLASLGKFFGKDRLSDITKASVEEYVKWRLKQEKRSSVVSRRSVEEKQKNKGLARDLEVPLPVTVSKATVNREVSCLSALLSYAARNHEIDFNPIQGMEKLKEPRHRKVRLDLVSEARLVEEMPKWLQPVYWMAVLTACRLGELTHLRWRDVDFDTRMFSITDSKTADGVRDIRIHQYLIEMLQPKQGDPAGFVIDDLVGDLVPAKGKRKVGESDEPLIRSQSISHAFKRAARRIGRGDLRWHDTRHIAATRMMVLGLKEIELAEILGHSSTQMVKVYAQPDAGRMGGIINRLPSPLSASEIPIEDVPQNHEFVN